MEPLELDGAQGEGGGQILRSALTLSMITSTPFRIDGIRARRPKPGLLRQHLTAVQAAADISGAQVAGAEPGSRRLEFRPGATRGGDYRWAIGTAGSCTLVLQTVLPALWFADGPSTVWVSGGTHNPAAPPAHFLMAAWLPLMRRMGVATEIELLRHGFYPAGGGEVTARVSPTPKLMPLHLPQRGEAVSAKATAIVASVPSGVADRELARLTERLGPLEARSVVLPAREGPGNALMVELTYAHIAELFTAFGERGVPAETVADRLAKTVRHYRDGTAAVGEHLADQLVLPMALAGGGSFTTTSLSPHLETNLAVIRKFLPTDASIARQEDGWRVGIGSLQDSQQKDSCATDEARSHRRRGLPDRL
jgi:RNA 3'-terminal phosphate cyclase (ATP)